MRIEVFKILGIIFLNKDLFQRKLFNSSSKQRWCLNNVYVYWFIYNIFLNWSMILISRWNISEKIENIYSSFFKGILFVLGEHPQAMHQGNVAANNGQIQAYLITCICIHLLTARWHKYLEHFVWMSQRKIQLTLWFQLPFHNLSRSTTAEARKFLYERYHERW